MKKQALLVLLALPVFVFYMTLARAQTVMDGQYHFNGHYHDYYTPNNCRRVPAVLTFIIRNGKTQVSIEAPDATCQPPQFSESAGIMRVSLLPIYGAYFTTQNLCHSTFHPMAAAQFEIDPTTDQISDPVIFLIRGQWSTTLFDLRSHTLVDSCRD